MKTNNENLTQNYDSGFKTSSSSRFTVCVCVFGFSVLAFGVFSSGAAAEIPPEQLNPTDLLMSHLTELLQNPNMPNIPLQVAELEPAWLMPTQIDPFLWKAGDIAPVSFVAQADQIVPQSSFNISEDPNSPEDPNRSKEPLERVSLYTPIRTKARTRIGRQLWQAHITPPESKNDNKNEDELKRLIGQIYSIEFKPPSEIPEPVIVLEPLQKPEPNQTPTDMEVPEEPEQEVAPKLPYEPLTDQTLQMLTNLLQHPDQLNNPFELGEVLFLSGHIREAAVAYKEALNRKRPDEPGSAKDRAWILLQIGNCLRNDDPPAAAKTYGQLIREYPDSPWADLAKAEYKLIDWYLNDKPREMIAENRSSDSLIENGVSRK